MRLAVLAAVSFGIMLPTARAAQATEYWFGGQDPVARGEKPHPADWMLLFQPGSPWQQGESRLTAFKVSAQFMLRGTDDMIRTAVNSIHQHHVAFAVEMGSVAHAPGECGGGEGFAGPDLIDRVAGRLQKLGLTLDYWAMDEPLWFGHERSWGRNDCTFSVDEVAERVARNVATMRRYFPHVIIGDIEVLGNRRISTPQLVGDYVDFAHAFQHLTGQKLAFMHFDVAWRNGGGSVIGPMSRQMRAMGIRVGVIIGGDLPDPDDQTWVADGLEHVRVLTADPSIMPDDIIVQSWQDLPTLMLPETNPGSSTFELLQTERLAR